MSEVNFKLTGMFLVFLYLTPAWHINLSEAQLIAQKEHKFILLNFSGSDWCGPCIRMKKEIFESEVFKQMADTELVLVNADFPRDRKNQLTEEQQKINEATADKYNSKGIFPLTVLLNDNGLVIGTWEGLPNESADIFIKDIHKYMYMSDRQ